MISNTEAPSFVFQGVKIIDTFAEAFPITGTRVIVTAVSKEWAFIAATTASGYASSVIGCDTEAGIERELSADETPDPRRSARLKSQALCHSDETLLKPEWQVRALVRVPKLQV